MFLNYNRRITQSRQAEANATVGPASRLLVRSVLPQIMGPVLPHLETLVPLVEQAVNLHHQPQQLLWVLFSAGQFAELNPSILFLLIHNPKTLLL